MKLLLKYSRNKLKAHQRSRGTGATSGTTHWALLDWKSMSDIDCHCHCLLKKLSVMWTFQFYPFKLFMLVWLFGHLIHDKDLPKTRVTMSAMARFSR